MSSMIRFLVLICFFLGTLFADPTFKNAYYGMPKSEAYRYFLDYFYDEVIYENHKILEERRFIESLQGAKNLDILSFEYKKLQELQTKYKIQELYDYKKYLRKIDVIPPSLALAQAAVESGWGKSRFFKEANNIFGHWTYNPEIGLLPLRRKKGKKHFIRIFKSLQDSISAYMLNLNRNGAYYEFRLKRKEMRIKNKMINGQKLSQTMKNYSGIGDKYVKILNSIIRKHKLTQYDKRFYNELTTQTIQ